MHPLETYLKHYHLEALTVSVVAQVRYTTVLNATRGHPIKWRDTEKIRRAVVGLTGIPYTGPLALTEPETADQLAILPIRKLPKHNLI